MKKLTTLLMFLVLCSASFAQWTFEGEWPDTNYRGGAHGIAVDPDGKVWTASYYQINWNGVNVAPILVFNADGSFVDTIYTVTVGSDTDTLGIGGGTSGCRGLGVDEDGNIIYVAGATSRMWKINYQTMEGMAFHAPTETGSSPTAPSVSSDGTVYVGPVVGGGSNAIATYDTDLNFLGNAVVGPPAIARTLEVSDDGLSLYWLPFTYSPPQAFVYTRPDEFSAFALEDSLVTGMSIESSAWQPGTGYLWVSNDTARGTGSWTNLTWYGIDVSTNTVVDSFTLPSPDPVPVDEFPRALDFSPDGSVAYVSLFGSKYARIYKFTSPVGVKPDPNTIVEDYTLEQNFPNPFNPTTQIKFTVAKEGFVTLKVYDLLGKEVAALVNENLTPSGYSVNFDASDLASGTYIYTLSVNGVSISKKMMFLK